MQAQEELPEDGKEDSSPRMRSVTGWNKPRFAKNAEIEGKGLFSFCLE